MINLSQQEQNRKRENKSFIVGLFVHYFWIVILLGSILIGIYG